MEVRQGRAPGETRLRLLMAGVTLVLLVGGFSLWWSGLADPLAVVAGTFALAVWIVARTEKVRGVKGVASGEVVFEGPEDH